MKKTFSNYLSPCLTGRISTGIAALAATLLGTTSCFAAEAASNKPECTAKNTVTAKVVALEQVYYYNRFGSYNPSGMMYALRRDVVKDESGDPIAAAPDGAPRRRCRRQSAVA